MYIYIVYKVSFTQSTLTPIGKYSSLDKAISVKNACIKTGDQDEEYVIDAVTQGE